jgi:hypothetical protein
MKLAHTVLVGTLLIGALSACHRGMICPAFQSSFIQDDSVRMATFSPFQGDSLPKEIFVDKNEFGIINQLTYAQKINSFKTIEMILVFPPMPPSTDSTALLAPPVPGDSLEYQMTNQK